MIVAFIVIHSMMMMMVLFGDLLMFWWCSLVLLLCHYYHVILTVDLIHFSFYCCQYLILFHSDIVIIRTLLLLLIICYSFTILVFIDVALCDNLLCYWHCYIVDDLWCYDLFIVDIDLVFGIVWWWHSDIHYLLLYLIITFDIDKTAIIIPLLLLLFCYSLPNYICWYLIFYSLLMHW